MKNFNCFRLHGFFKSISNSFLSLFVPIIIFLNVGYKFSIIYLCLLQFVIVLVLFIFKNLIKKHTLLSICLQIFFSILAYVFIMSFKLSFVVILLVALFNGISNALYHASMFSIVAANNKSTGFSILQLWQYLGNILMILFNGYILNLNKNFSVFLIALISFIFFIISVIPLFMMKDSIKQIGKNNEESFTKIVYKTRHFNFFNIVFGLQCFISETIIPVYLAINNLNIEQIAIIVALINLAKIFINSMSNSLYKKNKSLLLTIIGSIIFAATCVILPLSTNTMVIYVVTVFCGFVFPMFYTPSCNEYSKVIKNCEIDGMIIREISVHIFRPLMLLPFIFIDNLTYLIYFGVVIAVLQIVSGVLIFKKPNVK